MNWIEGTTYILTPPEQPSDGGRWIELELSPRKLSIKSRKTAEELQKTNQSPCEGHSRRERIHWFIGSILHPARIVANVEVKPTFRTKQSE